MIPTDGYELPRQQPKQKRKRNNNVTNDENINSVYQITTLEGKEIIKPHIRSVIADMVARRLMMNETCAADTFPMRHSAAFVPGTKWREKSGIWREFNERGPFWVLLWPPR